MNDDWELFEAWRAGDDASGEILILRHMGLLTRFFRRRVSNPDDVADLISDTVLACTQSKTRVTGTGDFRSFLRAAAMNMLGRYLRKKYKRAREIDDFERLCVELNDPRSLTSLVAARDQGRLLVRALQMLSAEQQLVLKLSIIDGRSAPQIAKRLGIPIPTVYTRKQRGMRRLRKLLLEPDDSQTLGTATSTSLRTWALRLRLDAEQCDE